MVLFIVMSSTDLRAELRRNDSKTPPAESASPLNLGTNISVDAQDPAKSLDIFAFFLSHHLQHRSTCGVLHNEDALGHRFLCNVVRRSLEGMRLVDVDMQCCETGLVDVETTL